MVWSCKAAECGIWGQDDWAGLERDAELPLLTPFLQAMFGKPETQGTPFSKAAAAAVASLPEGFTIQPIEVSKIALQLDKTNKYNNNASAVIKDIMATRGWTGLFIGYFGIQYRQTSWTAAYFATLSSFSKMTKTVIPDDWKMTQNLLGGFAAGMFGAIFNTPGDVIRSAQQKSIMAAAPVKNSFSPGLVMSGVSSFFAMGAKIAAEKGVGGLYSGFSFKALHLGGSGALLAMLIPMFKVQCSPSPQRCFVLPQLVAPFVVLCSAQTTPSTERWEGSKMNQHFSTCTCAHVDVRNHMFNLEECECVRSIGGWVGGYWTPVLSAADTLNYF